MNINGGIFFPPFLKKKYKKIRIITFNLVYLFYQFNLKTLTTMNIIATEKIGEYSVNVFMVNGFTWEIKHSNGESIAEESRFKSKQTALEQGVKHLKQIQMITEFQFYQMESKEGYFLINGGNEFIGLIIYSTFREDEKFDNETDCMKFLMEKCVNTLSGKYFSVWDDDYENEFESPAKYNKKDDIVFDIAVSHDVENLDLDILTDEYFEALHGLVYRNFEIE